MKFLIAVMASLMTVCSMTAVALDINALSAALNNAQGRPDADKARDEQRKPAHMLDFFGIEPGMTVVDLIAATGYYTEVLAHAVGPNGKVYMQNSPAALTGTRGEATAAAIAERLAGNRLPQIEQLHRLPNDLGLPDGSVDAAVIVLEFHEFYRSDNPNAASEFLAEIRRVLKVGGVLGIIDHAAYPVYDYGPMHRAEEAHVVRDAQAAGFFVEASSPLLRNPADDRSLSVFDGSIRGGTDRFALKLIKRR